MNAGEATGSTSPAEVYSQALQSLRQTQALEQRREIRLGYSKLVVAALTVTAAFFLFRFPAYVELLALPVVLFIVLAVLQEKLIRQLRLRSRSIQFYERGQRNGARKETFASVVRKSAIGGLCASPLAFLLPFALLPELIGIPAIVGMALFVYFNHRRHHPSHELYLRQENTYFSVIPDAPQPRVLPAPQQRLLSNEDDLKGDNQ